MLHFKEARSSRHESRHLLNQIAIKETGIKYTFDCVLKVGAIGIQRRGKLSDTGCQGKLLKDPNGARCLIVSNYIEP